MMSRGGASGAGIPVRNTIFTTLTPSGGDDTATIQTALDSCPVGQVVLLNAGTFNVSSFLLLHSAITLRGAGAGSTTIFKTNGVPGRSSTAVSNAPTIFMPASTLGSYDTNPVLIVGPSRFCGPDVNNANNSLLTVSGRAGDRSITVGNGSLFTGGTVSNIVTLDELTGPTLQPTPTGFPPDGGSNPYLVYQGDKIAWNMHRTTAFVAGDDANKAPGDDSHEAMGYFCRPDPIGPLTGYLDGGATCEMKEIQSVAGNVVTFTSPLTIDYRVSHGAFLRRFSTTGSASTANSVHVQNAGVERLTLSGGADACLRFECAAYCWAKNIEITQWLGEGCAINNSFRIELRDSYIHTGSWTYPGGGGYAISLADATAEVLIENCISRDVNKVMVCRSSGAGSVVAYNYMDDGWDADNTFYTEVGLNASHMAGPHHVLFEGNYSFNIDSDFTHGSACYLTFLRNYLTGVRASFSSDGPNRCIGLAYGSWWNSFVGNIMGRPGLMSGYSYTAPAMTCDVNGSNCTGGAGGSGNWTNPNIWMLGYDPIRYGMFPDPKVLSTVIRDGNYDYLTNSQRWHNTPATFAIPPSMYLAQKPAFFGANAWPWVEPATGTLRTLPAKARWDGGTPNVVP